MSLLPAIFEEHKSAAAESIVNDSNAKRENLSREEYLELHELFKMVDEDGGGSIDRMELKRILDTIGVYPRLSDVNLIFSQIDEDDSGEIEFEGMEW